MNRNLSYLDLVVSTPNSPTDSITAIKPFYSQCFIDLPKGNSLYTMVNTHKYNEWKLYYNPHLLQLFSYLSKYPNLFQNITFEDFSLYCYEYSSKKKPSYQLPLNYEDIM
jgi:hypothetical protein